MDWFNEAHPTETEKKNFDKPPLTSFEGVYTNQWGDRCEIKVKDDSLVYEKFGVETKLVRVSETEFLPEKDQSMKLEIDGAQMIRKPETGGDPYILSNESLAKSQEVTEIPVEDEATSSEKNLTQKDTREITQRYKSALKDAKVEAPTSDNKQLNAQNPIDKDQERPIEPTTEDEEVQYRPKY